MSLLQFRRNSVATVSPPSLGDVLSRWAAMTSVARTRAEDGARLEVNGGTADELMGRLAVAVADLEIIVRRLEDAAA